jgi:hypothetical protein
MVLPYTIDISDDRLAAIKAKVEAYDWSQLPDGGGWTSGVGVNDLKRLVAYWRDAYDWRKVEHRLNQLPCAGVWPAHFAAGACGGNSNPLRGRSGRGRSPAIRDGLLWMSSW